MGATAFNSVPKVYYGINQGKLKVKVDKDTPKAIRREYTDPKDSTEKEVWELHYKNIVGYVYKIESVVKDFGLVHVITLMDDNPDEPLMVLSIIDGSSYVTDLFKKLPNVNFGDLITIQPYEVERTDKPGKFNRGVTIIQEGRKLENFFYDKENKVNINGFPSMDEANPDSDDWKMYFLKVNKFLKRYIYEKVVPELENTDVPENTKNESTPTRSEINNNDIPVDKVEDDLPF